jgi:hypothetical protein
MYDDEEASLEDFAALDIQETNYEDLEQLLKKYREVYDKREAIRKEEKETNLELEALNRNIVRLYNTRGLTSQKLAGVGTFFIRATVMPKVLDNERLVGWLDSVGDGAIAPRSVHPSRLKSYMNERLTNGLELPSTEIMDIFTKEAISIRRAK